MTKGESTKNEPGDTRPPDTTSGQGRTLPNLVKWVRLLRWSIWILLFFFGLVGIALGHNVEARSWISLTLGCAGISIAVGQAIALFTEVPIGARGGPDVHESEIVQHLRRSNRRWKTVGIAMSVVAFVFFLASQLTYKLTEERRKEAEQNLTEMRDLNKRFVEQINEIKRLTEKVRPGDK